MFLVAVRVVHTDANDLLRLRQGGRISQFVRSVIGSSARGEFGELLQFLRAQVPVNGARIASNDSRQVNRAVVPDRGPYRFIGDFKPCELHAAAAFSRPARSSTPSSLRSSSAVAGAIGNRCPFSGMIPSRFIIYLMGIGFVSKNTAWLISSSRS